MFWATQIRVSPLLDLSNDLSMDTVQSKRTRTTTGNENISKKQKAAEDSEQLPPSINRLSAKFGHSTDMALTLRDTDEEYRAIGAQMWNGRKYIHLLSSEKLNELAAAVGVKTPITLNQLRRSPEMLKLCTDELQQHATALKEANVEKLKNHKRAYIETVLSDVGVHDNGSVTIDFQDIRDIMFASLQIGLGDVSDATAVLDTVLGMYTTRVRTST